MGLLEQLFSFVCGQNPSHTWMPGGEWLPCCQRCTGLYAAAAVAIVLQLALRMRPTTRFLQVHGLFLLTMIPLGYHWVPHGALLRTLSGLVFGFGVISFLWLLPGDWLDGTRVQTRRRQLVYAAGVGASLALVPVLAIAGGRFAAWILSATVAVGLAGLAGLSLMNLGVAIAWAVSRWTRSRLHAAR